MKINFSEIFKDVDGQLSFKRLQAAVYTLLYASSVIINLINSKKILDASLLDPLVGLLAFSYTGIVAEKFTKRIVPGSPEDNSPAPAK